MRSERTTGALDSAKGAFEPAQGVAGVSLRVRKREENKQTGERKKEGAERGEERSGGGGGGG